MGKKLLKRRINQPSANPAKIEKWYENLKWMLECNENGSENLKSILRHLENIDTNLN